MKIDEIRSKTGTINDKIEEIERLYREVEALESEIKDELLEYMKNASYDEMMGVYDSMHFNSQLKYNLFRMVAREKHERSFGK